MADDFDIVRRGIASVMQFKAPNITDSAVYDDAVAAEFIWDSSSFFHRIKTDGAGPLTINLSSLNQDAGDFVHSLYFGYWNGGSGDEVVLQPDTLDSINKGAAGVPLSIISTGNIMVFTAVTFRGVWHIGTFSPGSGQEVSLTSGGGCTITGTYPDFTISVP
jgi:hypothetical protein